MLLPEATLGPSGGAAGGWQDGPQEGEGEGEQTQVNTVRVWLLSMLEQNPLLTSENTSSHRRRAQPKSLPVFFGLEAWRTPFLWPGMRGRTQG